MRQSSVIPAKAGIHLFSRSEALRKIRQFFHERTYIEVATPAIVPSPGMDLHLDAFEIRDHKGAHAGWLTTSPEYHMKRLLAEGMEKIYQLGPAFRSGELGNLHQPQFTMLEWYRAQCNSEEMRHETEDLICSILLTDADQDAIKYQGRMISLSRSWAFYPMQTAFEEIAEMAMPDPQDEVTFFRAFAEKLQPKLGWDAPVWITHWPASMASLAQLNADGTADRFELFIAGTEICNGFLELTDAAEQRKRFERDQAQRQALGKTVYPIDEDFLKAIERGIPTCNGNALGIDRLLMLLCDTPRIQDVIAFPA